MSATQLQWDAIPALWNSVDPNNPGLPGIHLQVDFISDFFFPFLFDAFSRLWNLRNDTRLWIRSSVLQKPQNSVVDCRGSRVSISGKRLLEYERNEIVMFCISSILWSVSKLEGGDAVTFSDYHLHLWLCCFYPLPETWKYVNINSETSPHVCYAGLPTQHWQGGSPLTVVEPLKVGGKQQHLQHSIKKKKSQSRGLWNRL